MTTAWTNDQGLIGARVVEAAAAAPHFCWERSWRVQWREEAWWVLTSSTVAELDQPEVLEIGAAAQRMVLAIEAAGTVARVEVQPPSDPRAVVVVRPHGPYPGQRIGALLNKARASGNAAPHLMNPSDLRRLGLSAETFCCELLWQSTVAASHVLARSDRVHAAHTAAELTTVLTARDGVHDWVNAGRAVAQCALVATELGFALRPLPHALADARTRQALRSEWSLEAWPQAQLSFVTRQEDF